MAIMVYADYEMNAEPGEDTRVIGMRTPAEVR